MDKFMGMLSDYLKTASTLIATYTPQAWQATLYVIRLHAIFMLLITVVMFLLGIGSIITGHCLYNKWHKERGSDEEMALFCLVPGYIGAALAFFILLTNITDWGISIINPKLELVYQLLQKAGII